MSKKKIPDDAASQPSKGKLSPIEEKILGLDKTSNDSPHVNLKYIQTSFECFPFGTLLNCEILVPL